MPLSNSHDESISEIHLKALYSLLPGVLREDLYGPKFSKQLQVWRESLHSPGKIDIRRLDDFDSLIVEVNVGDRLGCDVYYGFIQESWDYSLFMATLKPGGVVVDIGANFGMYTLGAAKRLATNGRVFSFEPDARSMALLKENIRHNKFENVVTCFDDCIGGYDGEVGFYTATDPSFSGIYETNRSITTSHLNLPIRRLDSVMKELGISQVDQIKIDIEGAESEAIEGATEILSNSDAIIMLEISSKNLNLDRAEKLAGVLDILNSQGYVSFHNNCEGSRAELCFEESLKAIARKTVEGKTRNYFLVKRDGKKIQTLQDAFISIKQDITIIKKNRLPGPIFLKDSGKDTKVLDHLHAALWAAGVEKQIALAFCRQIINQLHTLEAQLAETSRRLTEREEEQAAFNAKLTETSRRLTEREEELSALNSGFLGLLFRIKSRCINRGTIHHG